jgi:hypothetical protein
VLEAETVLGALLPMTAPGERDLYAGEIAYLMSQHPHVREAVGVVAQAGTLSGSEGATALSLAELRSLASPELGAQMPAPVAVVGAEELAGITGA